jgi:uncharacterized protein
MTLFDQINKDLMEAMKSKDKVKLEALRGIKKGLIEAKSAVGSNHELSDQESVQIISKLAKQGRESASIYQQQGRSDLAQIELDQIMVFETYLPAMLTEKELEEEIRKIIQQTGASNIKEMGKVMGIATKALSGRADGKAISEMVKSLLS